MLTRNRQSSYAVRIPASVLSHGGLVASQLCFSSFHVVAALVVTDPLSFALWREMLSCVIMLAYARASRKSSIELPNKDWVVFIVCGVLNFTNVVGSLFALYYLSPLAVCYNATSHSRILGGAQLKDGNLFPAASWRDIFGLRRCSHCSVSGHCRRAETTGQCAARLHHHHRAVRVNGLLPRHAEGCARRRRFP